MLPKWIRMEVKKLGFNLIFGKKLLIGQTEKDIEAGII